MRIKILIVLFLSSLLFVLSCRQKTEIPPYTPDLKNYRGSAVIGNGEICVVYSDDVRTFDTTNPVAGGILQYYYLDFSTSYIRGSSFYFSREEGPVVLKTDTLGIDPFFSPFSQLSSEDIDVHNRIFVTEPGLTVQRITVHARSQFDGLIRWNVYAPPSAPAGAPGAVIDSDVLGDAVFLRYDNGTVLAFSTYGEQSLYAYDAGRGVVSISAPLSLPTGAEREFSFFIAAGKTDNEVITKLFAAEFGDLYTNAVTYWNNWLAPGNIPMTGREIYRQRLEANLYSVRAAVMNGIVPGNIVNRDNAEIDRVETTRDAMTTARMFLNLGYTDLTTEIITALYSEPYRPRGHSGPASHSGRRQISAGSDKSGSRDYPDLPWRVYVLLLADSIRSPALRMEEISGILEDLIETIDTTGLVNSGNGIDDAVYIPAHQMIAAVALQRGSEHALLAGDPDKSAVYRATAEGITANLGRLYDPSLGSYFDLWIQTGSEERYWNTATNSGLLWGYPDHPEAGASNAFYLRKHQTSGGGFQRSGPLDNDGLSSTGDYSITATAAAAQYHALYGDKSESVRLVHWLIDHANSYGLMQERILWSEDDSVTALSMTGSSAEFVNALLVAAKSGIPEIAGRSN